MPLQATSGAASYDAFGGGVAAVPNYIEDVFSTWLYTGTGAAQTITNGIDLSGKGGLVWLKSRSQAEEHGLIDTVRGRASVLRIGANSTAVPVTSGSTNDLTAFNSNGFSLGTSQRIASNDSGSTYASWTFREQPKFFDVVTYTGDGAAQTINHNLASVPGCIIVKRTDTGADWGVYHRSVTSGRLYLNQTSAIDNPSITYVSSTSTSFTFTGDSFINNASGGTYVAYLFAHNAGGFGLSGTDNVISCGSFTYNATSGTTVNLGFEPQFIIGKNASDIGQWAIADNMRGMPAPPSGGSGCAQLFANLSAAESDGSTWYRPTATGFYVDPALATTGDTFIYIAIRRGPMRTPTTGTSVFAPNSVNAATGATVTTNFPVDLNMVSRRTTSGGTPGFNVVDRLRGVSSTDIVSFAYLLTYATSAEASTYGQIRNADNTGFKVTGDFANEPVIYYSLKRAPGFFDVVCYTGTGANRTVAHNLGVAPELMIVKRRDVAAGWPIYSVTLGASQGVVLQDPSAAFSAPTYWNSTSPTASVFTTGTNAGINGNGNTFVAYLFASCPGVSKVGSYTGTGTTQVINCGFTAGSRFVLIKRTDDVGDWYVWDSARGIVAGNDPYLLLNSTAAEVTNTDFIDTASTGFEISSTAPAAINASGGTYIFLAIA